MYFLYSSGVKKPITKIIKHNNTLLYYSAEKNTWGLSPYKTQINLTWYSNYTPDMAVSFQNDTDV